MEQPKRKEKRMSIDYFELQELVAEMVCDGNEELIEEMHENDTFDDALMERYDGQIDMSVFERVVEDLINYTPILQSPITNELFHAFGKRKGNSFVAIIKQRESK